MSPCDSRFMALLYSLQQLDTRLFRAVFLGASRSNVCRLAKVLSRSGDGYLFALLPLLLLAIGAGDLPGFILLLLLGLSMERCAYWVLKNTLRRPRPPESMPDLTSLVQAADRFSFPSGHTSAAFLLSTSLVLTYQAAALPMFLWAASIALSRVVLGVHYPGDTLAGALMGTGIALACAGALGM